MEAHISVRSRSSPVFQTVGSQIAVRSALHAVRLCPSGRFLVFISVSDRIDPKAIVRLEGSYQLYDPKIS
jgi:hypothetical protein